MVVCRPAGTIVESGKEETFYQFVIQGLLHDEDDDVPLL